jgi:hypothetical protein
MLFGNCTEAIDKQFADHFVQILTGNLFHNTSAKVSIFAYRATHVYVYTINHLAIFTSFATRKANVGDLWLGAGIGATTPVNPYYFR